MNWQIPENLSLKIKERAIELGFDICGIALARSLDEYGPVIRNWVGAGMHDRMGYLARDIEKRLDPRNLFPDTRSLVVVGLSYYSEIMQKEPQVPILSRYVYGSDYHDVIESKLEFLFEFIKSLEPGAKAKIVVDTSSLLEKAWGMEAGLGWHGRNSILINKKIGSFFFIGILLLDIDLKPDKPFREDFCGECRLCIEKCPTGAINNNRTIDARRCISNLTIENRGPIAQDILPLMGRRVYGCDICQEICPWNSKLEPNKSPELKLDDEIAKMKKEEWMNLSRGQFLRLFNRSAAKRIKYEQFISNIRAILEHPD